MVNQQRFLAAVEKAVEKNQAGHRATEVIWSASRDSINNGGHDMPPQYPKVNIYKVLAKPPGKTGGKDAFAIKGGSKKLRKTLKIDTFRKERLHVRIDEER